MTYPFKKCRSNPTLKFVPAFGLHGTAQKRAAPEFHVQSFHAIFLSFILHVPSMMSIFKLHGWPNIQLCQPVHACSGIAFCGSANTAARMRTIRSILFIAIASAVGRCFSR